MSEGTKPGLIKYHKDMPFSDPVVRCDSCSRLILRSVLSTRGCCICGNRRVRNVLAIESNPKESASSVDELAQLKGWVDEGLVDPDFLDVFDIRRD